MKIKYAILIAVVALYGCQSLENAGVKPVSEYDNAVVEISFVEKDIGINRKEHWGGLTVTGDDEIANGFAYFRQISLEDCSGSDTPRLEISKANPTASTRINSKQVTQFTTGITTKKKRHGYLDGYLIAEKGMKYNIELEYDAKDPSIFSVNLYLTNSNNGNSSRRKISISNSENLFRNVYRDCNNRGFTPGY